MLGVGVGVAEGAVMTQMIPPRLELRTLVTWLTWHSAVLVVVLFLAFKATAHLVLGRHWHSFGRLDLAELLVLALLVGGGTLDVPQGGRQKPGDVLPEAERGQQH